MVFRKKDDYVLKLKRRDSATATTTDSQKIKTEPVAEKQWWLEQSKILNKETETQNPESSVSAADERSAKIEDWWLEILEVHYTTYTISVLKDENIKDFNQYVQQFGTTMLLCSATHLISGGEHFERVHLQIQTASAEYR